MMEQARRFTKWGIAGVLLLGLSALVVGTMGRTASSTFSHTGTEVLTNEAGGRAPANAGVSAPAPAVAQGAPSVSGDASGPLPNLPDLIARTGDLIIEVKKGTFDSQWTAAFKIAQRYNGQIMSSNRGVPTPVPIPLNEKASSSDKQPAIGDITIRVPSQSFISASNALRALGTVRGDNTTTEDVSQEYVDLQSRLRNLRAEQNVLIALFNKANTIRDTLAVQGQLSTVEGQIEQVTGRIKYLDSRTVFSTITLHLQEPGVTVITTVKPGPSLGGAWDTAKTGLVRLAGAGLILGLWGLPFAALGIAGLVVWRWARRPAPQV